MNASLQKPLIGRFWHSKLGEGAAQPGVLTMQSNEIKVELEGALWGERLLSNGVVFGRLAESSEPVTLINCFGGTTFRGRQATISHIDSTLLIQGCHDPDPSAYGIQFRLRNSAKWFHDKTFDYTLGDESESASVTYQSYESHEYRIGDAMCIERYYGTSIRLGHWGTENLRIRRPLGYRIHCEQERSFDELWYEMTRFRRLLEFLSQHPMPQGQIYLATPHGPNPTPFVTRIRHTGFRRRKPEKFEWDRQLLTHDDVESDLPELMTRWFTLSHEAPEIMDRYFSAYDRNGEDPVLHFLWHAAALEELHKARNGRKHKPLFERLLEIVTRWASALPQEPSRNVLEEIKNTRHYYAHAAGDLRGGAATEWKLLRYGYFLAALTNLELLNALNMREELILKAANRYWMREALALQLFPE